MPYETEAEYRAAVVAYRALHDVPGSTIRHRQSRAMAPGMPSP